MNMITKLSLLWCCGCILMGLMIWGLVEIADILYTLLKWVIA